MSSYGKRQAVGSDVKGEEDFGYTRAVRAGEHIFVSGTTASGPGGTIARGDAAGQARFILDKIETAIVRLGGCLEDVVRTRIYIRRLEDWKAVASVHGERFRHVRPANTLIQAVMVGEDELVEMEVEAMVGSGRNGGS